MRDKMCKKYQNKFNKQIALINKDIMDDDLWLGRFCAKQIGYNWYRFEDNSGGILTAYVRIFDKKDRVYRDFNIEYAPYLHSGWLLWRAMNKFITEYTNTWKHGRPKVMDFTKEPIPNIPSDNNSLRFFGLGEY